MTLKHFRYESLVRTFEKIDSVGMIIDWIEKGQGEGYFLSTAIFSEGLELDTEGITVHMLRKVEVSVNG